MVRILLICILGGGFYAASAPSFGQSSAVPFADETPCPTQPVRFADADSVGNLQPTAIGMKSPSGVVGDSPPNWVPPNTDPAPITSGLSLPLLSTTSEADISKPGPDMGDYPNSAYTLPKGRAYVEFAPFTYQTADPQNSASYNFPFLLRYGVTDNVELRLLGSGLTSVYDPSGTVTGVAPLIIDTKIHMWDDQIKRLIPAASLEVYVQTNWGSPQFQGGVQPSLNLNLDFPFTEKTNVEMTFGYTGVQDAIDLRTGKVFFPRFNHRIRLLHNLGLDVNQFAYQWAIEHQVTEKFQVFLHGYYNGPILFQSGPGKVVGVGYFYQINKRSTLFNSYNAAIDNFAPPFSTQLGLAFAF